MKKQQRIISWFLIGVICIQSCPLQAKINKKLGFKEVHKEKYNSDIMHHYVHENSGLEVIWIENKDVNKAFTIGIKTPTTDNTGVNHIIEHTVFTGSKKYPSSSLFFDANEAYPCTYMNALTSGDMTIFPFATPYEDCYNALLDIYLDAVFEPNLLTSPYGFYEEGFHSVPQEQRYGGVVYNEMKGAYSSTDRAIYRQIRQMIFKDSHYAYDSGGNPDAIPTLTYEACLNTYKSYYYPGNMKMIAYGDLDIEETLSKVAVYLPQEKTAKASIDLCDVSLNEEHTGTFKVLPTKERGCLVKAFVLDATTSAMTLQDLDLWMTAYLMGPQSYLQSYLNSQGLHARWLKDDDVPYPVYALVVSDLEVETMEKCSEMIDKIFNSIPQKLHANVFLEQDMLNETRWLLEKQEESNNRGVNIAQSILDSWAHEREENQYFIKKQSLDQMKSVNLSVKELLLEKANRYTLYLLPDETPFEDPLTLTPVNVQKWEQIYTEMKNWQAQKVDLEPVPLEKLVLGIDKLPTIEKKDDYWTMETRTDTNLARTQLYLNTSHIAKEELNTLFLYSYLLEESAKDTSPFSGSLTTTCTAYPLKDGYWPCFKVSLTTLLEEKEHGVLFNEARTNLMNRPESWYRQKLSEFVLGTKAASKNNVIATLASLSMAGRDERTNYIYESNYPFYSYCQQLLNLEQTNWIEEVKVMNEKLYHKGGAIIATTLDEKGKNEYQTSWEKVINNFEKIPNNKADYTFEMPQGDCVIPTESTVDHSYRSLYKAEGISGMDYLLAAYLTKNYLNPTLRVQIGAYGAGCQVYDLKTLGMYAYRAPSYIEALQVISDSGHYLKQIDEKKLDKSKAEALSKVHQQFKLLGTPLEKAAIMEHLILWGKSPREIVYLQNEILKTDAKSIMDKSDYYKNLINSGKDAVMTGKNYTKEQNFTIYRY